MIVQQILDLDWFSNIDVKNLQLEKLSPEDIILLLQGLNQQMVNSTYNWDGG